MKTLSAILIRLLGTRLYLRIPQRLRRMLGMVCGEDMASINRLLEQLKQKARREG